MRLTLRTLLALLDYDDALHPQESAELARKLSESAEAQAIVQRMHDAMARRCLGAADPLLADNRPLPEEVAGWLDNTLASKQVVAFELAALESDATLAEAAACHRILVDMLTRPSPVAAGLHEELYAIVPRAPDTKPAPSAMPASESLFSAPRVFVSHCTKDRAVVESEIIRFLSEHGIETWYAPDSIGAGVLWERAIMDGLRWCNRFVLVMSPHSARSKWVQGELDFAMTQRGGAIVPVVIGECSPYDFHLLLNRIQAIDLRKDRAAARDKLLQSLRRR